LAELRDQVTTILNYYPVMDSAEKLVTNWIDIKQ
jgi:hypothetical protein